MTREISLPTLPLTLNGGLILRQACPADVDALAEFNARVHSATDPVPALTYPGLVAWTRDLLTGKHPTFAPSDFTLVIDPSGKIVSAACLISQEWMFAGEIIPVGRIELVGTDPEYRKRGLVRRQFEALHAISAARGELMQSITGIPYYYRQFGYEMTVELGGTTNYYVPQQVSLQPKENSQYVFRDARPADAPFLLSCYNHAANRWLMAARYTEKLFRYEVEGKSADNINRNALRIITNSEGQPLGFYAYTPLLTHTRAVTGTFLELVPGASWAEMTPLVLSDLAQIGRGLSADNNDVSAVQLRLGSDHPALKAVSHLATARVNPYAWYIRVPDLPALLTRLGPVLEKRLENSLYPGFTGALKIGFYTSGLELAFENGRFLHARPQEYNWDDTDINFPGLTFLQLLTGYRSLSDLDRMLPDMVMNRKYEQLFQALFPTRHSLLWSIS